MIPAPLLSLAFLLGAATAVPLGSPLPGAPPPNRCMIRCPAQRHVLKNVPRDLDLRKPKDFDWAALLWTTACTAMEGIKPVFELVDGKVEVYCASHDGKHDLADDVVQYWKSKGRDGFELW
ncbi:hypothetical protein CBOM_00040 [Ceraceosorus bombacis]|uniref:Uncharacterized protein n=1 Tax=Ceraceosorus bombacis TaxID=401625 RepID=A0A0P1B8M5_9BASI|nr:hypothetical protein CBOM_00040 [Ceraceosorus bombacis]